MQLQLSSTDIIVILCSIIILIVLLILIVIYGVFIKKKSELLLIHQQKEAIFEQELARSQVELQNQTLKYIGQELHDDLGQKLSVARLMTSKLKHADPADLRIVEEINLILGESLQDIRNISKSFITPAADVGDFVESLEKEVFRIKRLSLLEVDYRINRHHLPINADHGLILFRIIQECITNVIKHSRSKSIQIIVEDRPKQTKFVISDKGIGFKTARNFEGIGLKNMINRAKIINAEFKISSEENQGTAVTIIYKKL
ncbi:sensor histidine kinase [Kaistella rhinocerotis]|uniref:sensor histidine kinase n=1 Tax=Kaistella rhinocerotis TaxID=3026437 RepID=UPI002554A093|nr:ATP-binding protein [Kaistella sp. Ran72]